ncbi:MAG TPA: hypothetical protein VIB39_07350 [Candidatus Angelobacter sp.]
MSEERVGGNIEQIVFTSGEIVPTSGIWRSSHEECDTSCELWIGKDSYFPPCPGCYATATFTLLDEVQHISEDTDFQD